MQHSFKKSLSKEAQFIKEKKHLPVLKQLNKELVENFDLKLDHNTYQEYYGNNKSDKELILAYENGVTIVVDNQNDIEIRRLGVRYSAKAGPVTIIRASEPLPRKGDNCKKTNYSKYCTHY